MFFSGVTAVCIYALLTGSGAWQDTAASLSPHSENLVSLFRDYLSHADTTIDRYARSPILSPAKRQTDITKVQNFAIWYEPNSGLMLCQTNETVSIQNCQDTIPTCELLNKTLNICETKAAAKKLGCHGTCKLCEDKCLTGEHNCHKDADCSGNDNSFTCKCKSGYSGDGVTSCTDIDECASGSHSCSSSETCENTQGSYTCRRTSEGNQRKETSCKPGYKDEGSGCEDIDECKTTKCNALATCTNTPGSYRCNCKEGYDGNGLFCFDKNECTSGTDNCHANALCENTDGSYTCSCNTGYKGDGKTCTDIDECSSNTFTCSKHSSCKNTPGSYSCPCHSGYQRTSGECEDIDECKDKNMNKCNERTTRCLNTPGSYKCRRKFQDAISQIFGK